MQLNKKYLKKINASPEIDVPADYEFDLPEKILQFGTGILLRGLPDYFICKTNRQRIFNGRIVVVKSTAKGDISAFGKQDNLFIHSIANAGDTHKFFINAAISRALDAKEEWQKVLQCASQKQLQIIISNTTEAGIFLDKEDDIHANPPRSFPARLLAFLYERYKIFNGNIEGGMVIIPTELIPDNAIVLKKILLEIAEINKVEKDFIEWLNTANDFCNSLVDRIVTASISEATKENIRQLLHCNDELLIESETYALWVIETSSVKTKSILSFADDKNIIIADDITKYRELKLRLLNATHTFCSGLALLYNFKHVNTAMQDKAFKSFVQQLMHNEIAPCIINEIIEADEAHAYADEVISRFTNPFINHEWTAIIFNYTEKIKARCVPLLPKHYAISSAVPQKMAIGFAVYLLYMKIDLQQLHNKDFWNEDLNKLPGFVNAIKDYADKIEQGIELAELIS